MNIGKSLSEIFFEFDLTNREYQNFHKIPDMSDDLSAIQQAKIIAD
jgi:hypothetical protein